MTETTREARLRSALEAALVALEVAADPANDIDPEGFGLIARVCRRTLEETGGPAVPRQVCPCGEIIDDFGACATCDAPAKSGDGADTDPDDIDPRAAWRNEPAPAFDPRADAPEGALNARDVHEFLGGRDPREVR